MNKVLKSFNPANGEVVGEVPVSSPEEIGGVVASAHRAALGWRDQSLEGRAELLGRAAERLDDRAEELGHLSVEGHRQFAQVKVISEGMGHPPSA